MKHSIIFLIGVFGSLASFAQSEKTMQVYVMAGVKAFSPKEFNSPESVAPSMVPGIGGGALWNVNRFQFGTEFMYLDGKKDTEAFGSILTGINANILAGYSWDLGGRMTLTAQTGFGYSLHHLAVTDNTYAGSAKLNSTIYHNMVISVPVALMIQRTSANGVFTGLRVGYQVPIGHNHWRYIEGDKTENYMSASDGLYIQVTFGGLLTLNKRSE